VLGSLGPLALLVARLGQYPGPVVEQLAELVPLARGVGADPPGLGGRACAQLLEFRYWAGVPAALAAWYWSSVTGSSQVVPSLSDMPRAWRGGT
jgi:hypothetical protein